VLLDKLQSGYLRFETPQGLAAAEPTFWHRVYLLWTFRNFHQLSPLLLNPRQTALINNLFRQHAVMDPHEYEPHLEIGIVENFVPSAIEIDTMPTARTDASRTMKTKSPEQVAGQSVEPRVIPIAASPTMMVAGPSAVKGEKAKKDGAGIDRVETAPENVPDRSFTPIVSWFRFALSNLVTSRLGASRQVTYRFAAAIGALSLCLYLAIAWHRIGAAPGSQTRNSVPQLNSPHRSSSAPKPTPGAMNLPTTPELPTEAIADQEDAVEPSPARVASFPPDSPSAPTQTPGAMNTPTTPELPTEAIADQEDSVEPSPERVASSIATTQQMMKTERGSRVPTARVARSRGRSHVAAFSRVPTSRSNRRTTLAPGSRGASARSARSYFKLADQQLHRGNYAAAAANYKRAWRIEEHIAAAKGRRARARLTMQAKNENIVHQR